MLSFAHQAAFIAGELASSAVASDTMRPLLAAASSVESLVFELAAALVAVCVAPAECIEAEAVPQYSAALEAITSLGQALRNCTSFSTRLHEEANFSIPPSEAVTHDAHTDA